MAARKNPGGGPKSDKPWRDALMLAVHDAAADGDGKKLRKLADRLVEKALDGDVTALKEIGDRLDGKPRQETELSGRDGGPIETVTKIELVAPDADESTD